MGAVLSTMSRRRPSIRQIYKLMLGVGIVNLSTTIFLYNHLESGIHECDYNNVILEPHRPIQPTNPTDQSNRSIQPRTSIHRTSGENGYAHNSGAREEQQPNGSQMIDCFQLEVPCQSIKAMEFGKLGKIKVAMYDPKVDKFISGWWAKNEWYAHHITTDFIKFMKNHPDPGDIIEVGANIGSVLLPLARNEEIAHRNTMIHAFEANKHNERMLQTSVALNGFKNVDIHFCAATNETHGETVHSNSHFGNMGRSKTTVSHKAIGDGLEVPTCTIDEALQSSRFGSSREHKGRKVSLIKLDCEGCEAKALMGAEHVLTEDKPAVFMEVTELFLRESGVTWRDLMLFMTSKGYYLFDDMHNPINNRYNLTDPTQSDFQAADDTDNSQTDVWWFHEDTLGGEQE